MKYLPRGDGLQPRLCESQPHSQGLFPGLGARLRESLICQGLRNGLDSSTLKISCSFNGLRFDCKTVINILISIIMYLER